MSHCFQGWDIHDSSAPPPPPPSITTNIILAPDHVLPYISSPGWEKPRAAAGTLESVVNQGIISRRHHKSAGDGGNSRQPAAFITATTTDALVPACDNNYNSIRCCNNTCNNNNYQEKSKHVPEFIPERADGGGTKHGSAGVCSCKTNARRRDGRHLQGAAGKRKEYEKSLISASKSRAAAMHNQSEKKRRDKITQRMKILQNLVPNCSKTDKVATLDDVIEYLKQLQAQVETMSMMMHMQPSMMLPLTMQQHLQMSTMGCAATMPPSTAITFVPMVSSDLQHLPLVMPEYM